ncbi:hypothetical protein IMSAGC019_01264 [Lachnospiraceae bacterium]|nr:hypothetical protein IMSAGC019_01264 [Lachnospiraceae bacterium]
MIAHINKLGEKQSIKEHLLGTAERAKSFAGDFNCDKVGYFCGILHDIGKYSVEFQHRINNPDKVKKVDHSTAGALEAMKQKNVPVAMAIAGHHSGLMDGGSYKFSEEGDGTFFGRIKKQVPDYSEWKVEMDAILGSDLIPDFCLKADHKGFTMSFFIRMLYSCLVDADYLDTEKFMDGGVKSRGNYASIDELCVLFDKYIQNWLNKTEFDNEKQKMLCESRNRILQLCMEKGEKLDRGLYTLTVPTGGGKTTASLGFSLKHMKRNGMKRVIYVIPYTSVIDQNAQVFEGILGEENVLEHHSGVQYEMPEGQSENYQMYQKVLATENWDMPVIVTTAVQFFESLFANKSSKCRKLHNIANSVVIFDEAQTLPIPYLEPCIAAISELVGNYRATVILCTATQPALENIFSKYLQHTKIQEICDGVDGMYQQFQRTKIVNAGSLNIEQLKEQISNAKQVLCIVNKRKTAQELYKGIPEDGAYCLTTLLCPMHRKQKFSEIRHRLKSGLPCRVIATSLIEAGVDLDFPKVYRQEIGLDSLIQAAGRCNREGKRQIEDSLVYLFKLEGDSISLIKQNVDALRETLRHYEDPAELKAVSFYFQFFRGLLGNENLDQNKILDACDISKGINGKIYPFASISERFKLIEDQTKTVYIPVGEGKTYIEQIRDGKMSRELFRKLGQFSVNVFPNHLKTLLETGSLEVVDDTVYILGDMNQYDDATGLQLDVDTGYGIFV